ncbi:MAG: hypothetical protein SGI99_04800, partial [Pseudomonadota bacterium]|nr:hypothetical protein [Pseudomonadota bacterium]
MHNDSQHMMQADDTGEDRALAAALRALPMLHPPVSALPQLQTLWKSEQARRKPTWQTHWWAIAAGVAVIGLGVVMFTRPAPEVATQALSPAKNKIELLMAQSAEWESALHRFEQQSIPMDAGMALASAELEDLIGLTDLQLGATETDSQAESLWQR